MGSIAGIRATVPRDIVKFSGDDVALRGRASELSRKFLSWWSGEDYVKFAKREDQLGTRMEEMTGPMSCFGPDDDPIVEGEMPMHVSYENEWSEALCPRSIGAGCGRTVSEGGTQCPHYHLPAGAETLQ